MTITIDPQNPISIYNQFLLGQTIENVEEVVDIKHYNENDTLRLLHYDKNCNCLASDSYLRFSLAMKTMLLAKDIPF